MQKIEVTLTDDIIRTLEFEATKLGLSLDDFVSRIIGQRLSEFLPGTPKEWMPQEQWEALVRGDTCPICSDLDLNEYANAYGYTIADLSFSRLLLSANQAVGGYCVLICKKHICELHHLEQKEQILYFSDLMRAAQAIEKVFRPVKMNFEIQGNTVPHLHCHIKPRFYGDAAPNAPIHPDKSPLFLRPEEYDERVRLIREAL
jgi:diadenosine tetraphosphate (Ap4A) HIT family hydrolase